MASPLQLGIPGAAEFVVALIISALTLAAVVLFVQRFSNRDGADEERVERLEAEVAELRERADDE